MKYTALLFVSLALAGLPPAVADWWRPPANSLWQLQYSGTPIDTAQVADIYDLDLFDTDTSTVAELKGQERAAICYISVGSYEDWRPDAAQFPPEVLGNDYAGWPGERWLDIRRLDLLGPILAARLDLCQSKGFDGVDPDNINGYQNDTGFPLTAADQLAFNLWLADQAHQRGLAIGMKNDPEQTTELVGHYDWALLEECFNQGWCALVNPYVDAGKPVFAIEYTDTGATVGGFCTPAAELHFQGILKHRDLDGWRQSCGGSETYAPGDASLQRGVLAAPANETHAYDGAITLAGTQVDAGAILNLRAPRIVLSPGVRVAAGGWLRARR